jgi:eukaryotic-like serine/threonine-protein kinase
VYAAPGFLLFSRGGRLLAQPFDTVSLTTTGDAAVIADRVQDVFGTSRQVVSVAGNGTLLYGWRILRDTRLEWVDRRGTLAVVAAAPDIYSNVSLSPDGTRVAFDRTSAGGAPDVWLLDLARHITSRFTFNPNTDNVTIWSPDGGTLAFASNDGKGLDIARRPANASAPPQVLLKLNAPPIMFPSDWSSDGRFVAYYRTDPKNKIDLWVLPLVDNGKPMPLLNSEFNESQAQFSPDVKWIAYVSDESGTPQVYVQSFPTLTGKWQVSSDGGSQPRWRRDGKELFYVSADRKLMAVEVKPGDVFDSGAPHALFDTTLPFDAARQAYSVSPDGQRFLLNTPIETDSSPFTIILNWTGLLKD